MRRDERLVRFVPFDPATKISEAFAVDRDGNELHIVKGAFEVIAKVAEVPADARRLVDDLAAQGHRVIAVAAGPPKSLRLVGLIALSDPPREDSAELIADAARHGRPHRHGDRRFGGHRRGDRPARSALLAPFARRAAFRRH